MPTSYPAALDSFSNPSSSSKLNDSGVVHSDQHANANDAIEAIQAELGLNPRGSSATVAARLGTLATSASPSLTGTPLAPTATVNTNTTQIATTAFVLGQGNSTAGTITALGSQSAGTSNLYARADHIHPTTGLVTTASLGANVATFLSTPSSANLASALTDEQGSTAVVFSNAPTITDLRLSAGTTSAPSFRLNSGVNLTSVTAGAIEFDGTVLNFTPNTNFGRASLPSTIYTSGQGLPLTPTATGETTAQSLFPTANDTITLPIGTYHIQLTTTITRGATSTTSATARINFGGGGTAVGSFSGDAISSIAAGGATSQFTFSASALTTDNVVTAANTSAGGVYNINLSGILRITTAGTFIPKYSLSAALTGATTGTSPSASTFMKIDLLNSSGSAASNGAWA